MREHTLRLPENTVQSDMEKKKREPRKVSILIIRKDTEQQGTWLFDKINHRTLLESKPQERETQDCIFHPLLKK